VRTVSHDSSNSSLSPTSSLGSNFSQGTGKGILANAHEAPKRQAKGSDKGFSSALKSAFIIPQAGKQMKKNGKPLGKSFERTQPLPTVGHEGGEVLKVDPRGQNATSGDGIVLETDGDDNEEALDEGEGQPWSPTSADSSYSASSFTSNDENSWEQHMRGRSNTNTTSSSMGRSPSVASSQCSSNNPCSIKFAPLPTSGRLKRANSITIGVAARSQLLHSQGGGRAPTNSAAWQAQANAQRYASSSSTMSQGGATMADFQNAPRQASVVNAAREADTVDLGEVARKGAMKAWRKIRRGSNVSTSSSGTTDSSASQIEKVVEEEPHEIAAGEKTPGRSHSPIRMSALLREDLQDEPEGARTPRHSMARRTSTGAFTGHNAFMEIEERRKRENQEQDEEETRRVEREENAQLSEALHRVHASRAAGVEEKVEQWHTPRGSQIHTPTEEGIFDEDDAEAERMANEALARHSDKATKAGAVEKMERKHR
jgi:hypothetical protein